MDIVACRQQRIARAEPGNGAARNSDSDLSRESISHRQGPPPLQRRRPYGHTLLTVGGAGGVGSILIQLARELTALTVVATASRPETRAWVEAMGAHHVIDHRGDMPAQMEALGLTSRYVAGLMGTEQHFSAIAEMLAPQAGSAWSTTPIPRRST